MSNQDKNLTAAGSFKYNEGQETISGNFSNTQGKVESTIRESMDSQPIQKGFEAKTPSFAVSPEQSRKLQGASVNNSYDFDKRDPSIQKIDDKSITIQGIKVIKTSEPKIQEQNSEKAQNPKYILDEDRDFEQFKGLPQLTVTKQPLNQASKKNAGPKINLKKNAPNGYNSVKNTMIDTEKKSRQHLKDEIITLQGSQSRKTMNEDIAMYDIGLDAYKLGIDSTISEDKNSTIQLNSRHVNTNKASVKGLEHQTERMIEQNKTESLSNQAIQLPSLPENILHKNQSKRDLTQNQYSLKHYSSSSDVSRQNFIQIKQSYHQIFNDTDQQNELSLQDQTVQNQMRTNQIISKEEGINEIKRIHSQLKMLNQQKKSQLFQESYQSLQNDKFKEQKRILQISQSMDKHNKSTAKNYMRQFSLQSVKFVKPQKTSKEVRERTNSQKQQMLSQLKQQQDRYQLKTSTGLYSEDAPHNLYQTNPNIQNTSDLMIRQNSLINSTLDGLATDRTNASQMDSHRDQDLANWSIDQQANQKNLFHLKNKLAIPVKKGKFAQYTSNQRTPDTYRSLFKDGQQRSLMTADVGQNQSTDINSLEQNSFAGFQYNTSVFSTNKGQNYATQKQAEQERKNIKQMLSKLDEKEIKFWNEQEQVIRIIKEDNKDLGKGLVNMNEVLFQKPIDYFSLIQQALNFVVLDNGENEASNTQSIAAGNKNESNQIYSKHFKKFIERICQSISISKQFFERNLEMSFSFKDKQIHKAYKIIEALQENIEELQSKLINEEDFLSEARVKDMKRQVEEFLNSNPIGHGGDKEEQASEQDIFEILKQNKYSGVKLELSEVMRQMHLGSKKKDDDQTQAVQFDLQLLDNHSFTFQQELEKHFIQKAKAVQLSTSKKVIKQFHKNAELEEVGCQTGFKDDQFIKELEGTIVILRKDIDDLREQKASDSITIQGLRKAADDLNIKIISQQTKLKQTEYNLGQLDDQFRAESKRAEKLLIEKQEAEERQNKLTEIISQNQEKIQDSDQMVKNLRQQVNDLSTQVRRQKQTIDDTESQNSHKMVEFEQKCKDLEEKLKKSEAERKVKEQVLYDMSKQVELYKNKASNSRQELKELQQDKPSLNRAQSVIVNPSEIKSAGLGKQLSQTKSIKIDDLKAKQVQKMDTTQLIVEEQSSTSSKGTIKNQNQTPMLTDHNDSPRRQAELKEQLQNLDKNLQDTQNSWIDSMHQRKQTDSSQNIRRNSSLNKDLNLGDNKNERNQQIPEKRKQSQAVVKSINNKTLTPGIYDNKKVQQNPVSTLNQDESLNSFGKGTTMQVLEYPSSSRDGSQEESNAYMHQPKHSEKQEREQQNNDNTTINTIELEGNQNQMMPNYPSPQKKNWVLIQSQKELQSSEKQIDQLVQKKVSRIPYLDTPMQPSLINVESSPRVASLESIQKLQKPKKMVSKNTQTVINTETFINILNLQNQQLQQKRDQSHQNSVATQCSRIQPSKTPRSKLLTGHAICFGQNVSEQDLERAQKIIQMEEKNKRIFYGSPRKENKSIQIPTNQPSNLYQVNAAQDNPINRFWDSTSTMQKEFMTQEQVINPTVTKNPPEWGNNDHIATHQTNADLEHINQFDKRPQSPSYQPLVEGDSNLFMMQGASPKNHIKKNVTQEKRSVGGLGVQSMEIFKKKFLQKHENEASTIQISPASKGNLQVFKHQPSFPRQNSSNNVNFEKKVSRDQSMGSLKSNISGPLGAGSQLNAKLNNVKTENMQSEHENTSNLINKNDSHSK